MVQMQTAAAKAQKDNGKDEPLDTTKMPLRSDAQAAKPTAVSSVSNVVS